MKSTTRAAVYVFVRGSFCLVLLILGGLCVGCGQTSHQTTRCTANGGPDQPTFSLASGTYNAVQTVSITSTNSCAKVYYTVDGTTPKAGTSSLYDGKPLMISSSVTLNAIAVANGVSSPANTAFYFILGVSPDGFSSSLAAYADHSTAKSLTAKQIYKATLTPGATVDPTVAATRQNIVKLYQAFGIDLSLDNGNVSSDVLLGLIPPTFSSQPAQPLSGDFQQPFSIDAPYYSKIPVNSPRVPIPLGYFGSFQLNTTVFAGGGDGIGLTLGISSNSDRLVNVYSADGDTFPTHVRADWQDFRGATTYGDKHYSFLNSSTKSLLNCWNVDPDPNGVDIDAGYCPPPTTLPNLGDSSGSLASGINDMGATIRAGESINPNAPIPHAVMGPVSGVWKARAYPAYKEDSFIDDQMTCDGVNYYYVNVGAIPYGGVLQLDPSLNFTKQADGSYNVTVGDQTVNIGLPAFRILEAMQNYGYYVVDFGCADMDVYSSVGEAEYGNFGGSYTVQTDIQNVITKAQFYVVTPRVRKITGQ
ncbi:MAG TPA: chitobiase/beta-hexosaminidase C-terminal domain-containing protein [Dongiaceae bacterium]|nr:chitobiase/beta-hexosaminidase C-terminal domain-containing protein [Dongiaceae bacterium]